MEQQKDLEITLKLPMSKVNVIVDALAARTFATEHLMNEVINQGNSQLPTPVAGWKARQEMAGFKPQDLVEEKTDTLGINEEFEDRVFAILGTGEEVKYAWGEGVIQVTQAKVEPKQLDAINKLVDGSEVHCIIEPSEDGVVVTFELMKRKENSYGEGLGADWNERLLGLFSELDQMKDVDFDFSEAGKVEVLCQYNRHVVLMVQLEEKALIMLDGTDIDGEIKELPEGKTLFTFKQRTASL